MAGLARPGRAGLCQSGLGGAWQFRLGGARPGKAGKRMSQQDVPASGLLDFRLDRCCPKCLAEQINVIHHLTAVAGCPCMPSLPERRVLGEDLDRRCLSCGCSGCERVADAYAEIEPAEGEDMSTRKTAV